MFESGKIEIHCMRNKDHQISFGSKNISFTLVYRERKSLGIKVYPDGRVNVIAPVGTKEKDVLTKTKEKAGWILKQQEHFASYHPLTPQRRFVNGETHLYMGRQYKLRIRKAATPSIKVYRGVLFMYSPDTSQESLKQQLNSWYKEKAKAHFNTILQEGLAKFTRYKITAPQLSIRFMEKRWGSCSPSGKIILNAELMKAPKGSIEYVVFHELCHLVHPNHTKSFFNLQERIMPDWKKWKDRLEYSMA